MRAGHVEAHLPGDARQEDGQAQRRARPGAIYVVPDDARLSLDIAKNLVVHFFVSRAMVATALASARQEGDGASTRSRERVQALSRLFKYEFQFRADATFERSSTRRSARWRSWRARRSTARWSPRSEHDSVKLYVEMVRNFVEGYRVARARSRAPQAGPLAPKELAKRAITIGERMFLAGEIERREAVSRPVIENAFSAFVDLGYLDRSDGKFVLPESYASAETVRTIEAKVAGFIAPI